MPPLWTLPRSAERARGWRTAFALACGFTALVFITRICCLDSMNNSSFWPANGALVVGFLVLPRRISLVFAAGCFLINVFANIVARFGIFDNILFSFLNCAVSLLAAGLTRRFCGASTDLSRFRRLMAFAIIAFVAAAAEAGLGEFIKSMARESQTDINDWAQWSFCDGLGLLIATPAVLVIEKYKQYEFDSDASALEKQLLVAVLISITIFAFNAARSPAFLFIYPMLVLIAFRAGPAWVLGSVMIVCMGASGFTAHGLGPLAFVSPSGPLLRADMVQPYLISLLICALPPNNALGERNRTGKRLDRLHKTARLARKSSDEANSAKSHFIANISHEIRTPLNGVLGMAQVLAMSDLTDAQRDKLGVIRTSGEILLGLLNDVLDFSKIEAGKLELERADFSLHQLLKQVADAFEPQATAKGLAFVVEMEPGTAGTYVGDPTRVRQILTNLASNAIKFTEAGRVVMRLRLSDSGVTIDVTDTGIGIPENKISRLFGKFEQVDASTTRRFGGTGLGLSICRDLAELMGGSMSIQSVLGEGSMFTVHLPLEQSSGAIDVAVPGGADRALAADRGDGGALRILAAEDNRTNQLVLTTLLAELGLTAVVVENGALAVSTWEARAFDLILMDMQMPVMDGMAATNAIRAAESTSGRVRTPIVAFTADVMSHQIERYRLAGMDAVVSKPVQFNQLIEALNMALTTPAEPANPRTAAA